jgi:hypothetical protein
MTEDGGTLFMAIEYVPGVDLSRVVDRSRAMGAAVPVPVALLIGQQMCEALGYAHRKVGADGAPLGIVHRDVSPQNVMVSYEGEVKVIDFGLAKSTARSKHTLPSTVLGKLGYMSPEQARAETVDHRSDIYSAGIVLWELLAGRQLVQGGTVGEMVAMMANPRVPSVREFNPEVSEAVDRLVLRALQADPKQRYARADDLARSINEQLVRESLNVSSEDIGNYVRAMCPEEFAAERQLQSRLSMMRKKGSSPDQLKPQIEGTMVRAPLVTNQYGNTQVRTPLPGAGGAPLTAAQRAMSTLATPAQAKSGPAFEIGAQVGGAAPQPSVQLQVPKSRAPMLIVLFLLVGVLGGGGFFAWKEYGEQLLGGNSGGDNALVVEPPPKKEPDKIAEVGKEPEPAKEEPAKKEEAPVQAEATPKKDEPAAAPAPLEKIEVKGPVMTVIRDGEHYYVHLPARGKLQEGDQVKLLTEPVPGKNKNLRELYGIASVVESKGTLARLLLDPDTKVPAKFYAVKDEGPKRVPKASGTAVAKADGKQADPGKEAGKEPAKEPAKEVAKADPPGPAPTTAKEEAKKEEPKKDEAKKEEPKQEVAKAAPPASNRKILTGGIVLGSGVFKKVHIYNRSDFDWHGCELRLPNRTYYRYEPDDQIAAGESDGIAFTRFKDDSRPEDPQAAHGWALVQCREGSGYLQFKTN